MIRITALVISLYNPQPKAYLVVQGTRDVFKKMNTQSCAYCLGFAIAICATREGANCISWETPLHFTPASAK